MITLFKPQETDFSHNGLGSLDKNIIDPVVEEDLNGIYSFAFKYPLFASHGLEIDGQSLVRVPMPNGDDQLFRVYKPVKSMGYIRASCYHIFYDLIDNLIEDTNIVQKDGQGAISQLGGATQYGHSFTFQSNITNIANSRMVRLNPVQALIDPGQENSFINRWGGELKRDNFKVHMNRRVGADKGVTIRHKKNLLGYEAELDYSSVVTRIMPMGFDGISIPEKYIDSPLINTYVHPKIAQIKYEDIKAIDPSKETQEEGAVPLEEAYQELRKRASEEFSINKIDIPKANYKVEFATLEKTEEYKHLKVLQKVEIGDTVTVKHEEDGFNVQARVIKYSWDPLAKKYIKMELGNFKETFTNIKADIERNVKQQIDIEKSFLEKAIERATELLTSALGGHVLKRKGEILIMDTEDPNTATKVWRWNINGFGYSSTGINGPYGAAITMDGEIVATFIKAGEIDASLIKAGILSSKDGSTWINMINGTFSLANGMITYDGKGFNINIRESVRNELKTIETYGINIISNKPENWEQGFIDEDTGEEWDMDDPFWEYFTQFGYNCRIRTKDYIEIDPTKFYVFSEQFLFKVYATNIQVYFYDAVSNYLGYQWHYNFLDPERIPEGTAKIRVSLMEDYQYSGSPIVYITPEDIANSHFKIEQGTEATDWTPCISDVSEEADLSHIKTGDEPTNTVSGTLWLAEFVLANQLLCFDGEDWVAVGWGEIHEILDRVSDVEAKQSQIVQTIDGITKTVQDKAEKSVVEQNARDVTLKFDQLAVGGENLLLKSDVPITSNAYLLKIYDIPEPIADGEEVTLQIKGYLGDGKTGFGIYNSGGTVQMALLKPEDIRNKNIYTKTFNWVVGGSENRAIHVYVLYSNVTVDSNIEWIKLERGNRGTDKSLHKSELKGATYNFNGDAFSIGGTSGDTSEHTNSYSKYKHSDGSYTQISASGLKRFVAGTGENYHYLLHIVNFIYGESSSTQAYWVQLPDAFKGKQFKVYFAISDSMNAPNYKYSIQRFVCTRHPDFSIDYANARVPVIAYKSNTLMDGYAPILNEVQGIMLAIY